MERAEDVAEEVLHAGASKNIIVENVRFQV
jgi:hypothetical protein